MCTIFEIKEAFEMGLADNFLRAHLNGGHHYYRADHAKYLA